MSENEKVSLGNVQLDQPIQQQQSAPQPGELGYVPPVDTVPLPSKGKVYPVDSAFSERDTIEIRSMTAKDEDILTSRALLKQGKAISTLLRSCIVNKAVDVEQLLVGDRNAILVAIRITGYGSEYDVTVDCPACEEKVRHKFELGKLEIKPLGAEPLQAGTNAFGFVLPVSKKPVVFKLFTGADERELSQTQEKLKKALNGVGQENAVTSRLFAQILSLGQETDRNKLNQIVRNLPAMDSRKLREYIDEISPGIKMEQEVTCPKCGEQSEVDVPLGTEFFWPSAS